MTTATKAAKAQVRCACGSITIPVRGVKVPARLEQFHAKGVLSTGCNRLVGRSFAQGHDARMKGLLQFAHRNDLLVSFGKEGPFAAADVASRYGFAHLVTAAVKAAATKPAPKVGAAKAPRRPERGKIGP